MQIDAAVQAGNSGGPVLDPYGNVIGMVKSKLDYKKIMKKYAFLADIELGKKISGKSSTKIGRQGKSCRLDCL